MKKRQWLLFMVLEQKRWMAKCGGNLQGYINNYCQIYGRTKDEAVAIFEADLAALQGFEKRVKG